MTRNATGCRYHLDLQQEWLPTAPHTLFWPDCHLFSKITYFIFSYHVSEPRSSEHLVSSELRSYRQLTPFSSSNCRLCLTPELTARGLLQSCQVSPSPDGGAFNNMGKPGSSHFRDPPLISEETPLKSEAVLIKYLDFWQCYCIENSRYICVAIIWKK